MDEPAGKAAVIWMVGEYGDEITVSAECGEIFMRCWCLLVLAAVFLLVLVMVLVMLVIVLVVLLLVVV